MAGLCSHLGLLQLHVLSCVSPAKRVTGMARRLLAFCVWLLSAVVVAGAQDIVQQVLAASDGSADDFFGYSVAASASLAVVGANGPNNQQGAAYVFSCATPSNCTQTSELTASASPSDIARFVLSERGNECPQSCTRNAFFSHRFPNDCRRVEGFGLRSFYWPARGILLGLLLPLRADTEYSKINK